MLLLRGCLDVERDGCGLKLTANRDPKGAPPMTIGICRASEEIREV